MIITGNFFVANFRKIITGKIVLVLECANILFCNVELVITKKNCFVLGLHCSICYKVLFIETDFISSTFICNMF